MNVWINDPTFIVGDHFVLRIPTFCPYGALAQTMYPRHWVAVVYLRFSLNAARPGPGLAFLAGSAGAVAWRKSSIFFSWMKRNKNHGSASFLTGKSQTADSRLQTRLGAWWEMGRGELHDAVFSGWWGVLAQTMYPRHCVAVVCLRFSLIAARPGARRRLPGGGCRVRWLGGERCRSVGRQEAVAKRPWRWVTPPGPSPSDVALAESETSTSTSAGQRLAFPGGG
jgi:hypothetical protein